MMRSILKRSTTAALVLGLTAALVSCGGTTPKPAATSVVVPETATVEVGKTTTLTATVAPSTVAQTVTWASDKPAVAEVDQNGVVTGKTAGTALVTACSTVTPTICASSTVTVSNPVVLTTASINFGTKDVTATGYTLDTGAAFVDGKGGWITEAAVAAKTHDPIDMTSATRLRSVTDKTNVVQGLKPEQYGMIMMDCGDVPSGNTCVTGTNKGPAAWEYPVVNGKYTVVVSVGDADKRNTNSSHVVNVEGQPVVKATTLAAGAFATATATVEVTDGYLTMDSVGGKNTKVNYITITPAQ